MQTALTNVIIQGFCLELHVVSKKYFSHDSLWESPECVIDCVYQGFVITAGLEGDHVSLCDLAFALKRECGNSSCTEERGHTSAFPYISKLESKLVEHGSPVTNI